MPDRDIIVVGASAGGVESLIQLCKQLPADLPAAIFITIHLASTTPSVLPRILTRAGEIPAIHPEDGEVIRPGIIYVAPPDYHLDISMGHVHLSHGPIENGYRPAIDYMFRTAAERYGPRVIGIVLSGMLSDGTLGLQAIHDAGGMTIVQDPEDALFPSMPENALRSVHVDKVLTLPGIAQEIVQQVGKPVKVNIHPASQERNPSPTNNLHDPTEPAWRDLKAFRNGKDTSPRSLITCPACGGVLWELKEADQIFYLCQTGHRYSLESLFGEHAKGVESALWAAVRILEERAALTHRLAEKSEQQGRQRSSHQFLLAAEKADQDAQVIRQILEQQNWIIGGNGSESETGDEEHEEAD